MAQTPVAGSSCPWTIRIRAFLVRDVFVFVTATHTNAWPARFSLHADNFRRLSCAVVGRDCEELVMPAKGSAEWKGDLPTGSGTFTAGDTIKGGYTFKSRFEDGPGSNPEQLIAAAHAACFTMSLSNMLAQAGHPPDSVHTDATVTLRRVDDKPTITKIELVTVGRVPGIDEAAFIEHAKAAKAGCPVSRALASVPEITLEASLHS
jgi:osmotically inducible protein OsmC